MAGRSSRAEHPCSAQVSLSGPDPARLHPAPAPSRMQATSVSLSVTTAPGRVQATVLPACSVDGCHAALTQGSVGSWSKATVVPACSSDYCPAARAQGRMDSWSQARVVPACSYIWKPCCACVYTGEYGLMGLLALGMCYVLLLANGSAQFGHSLGGSSGARPPWPQPRQDVPGWLALHAAYRERVHSGSLPQVQAAGKPSSSRGR